MDLLTFRRFGKRFTYVCNDPFTDMDESTLKWVAEQARDDLTRGDKVVAFVYGIAVATKVETEWRVGCSTKSGGMDFYVRELIRHFARNLPEIVRKNPEWFHGMKWRERALIWLLVQFSK